MHAVDDDAAHLLQTLVGSHARHRVALHEHVAVGEKLDGLERASARTDDTLTTLDKALLVAHDARDLDNVARNPVLQHLHRLRGADTTRKQLEQVARLEDDVRVPRLARRVHAHLARNQVQRASESVAVQRRRDLAPHAAQVRLTVLGEQEGEARLLEEGRVRGRIRRRHRLNFPVVNVLRVPG